MKFISWNICKREKAWREVVNSGADIALLQEATAPPPDIASKLGVDQEPWRTAGKGASRNWRAAVVRLSDRVQVEWLSPVSLGESSEGECGVSRPGTLSAARVTGPDGSALLVASMYGLWEKPHSTTGGSWIYADASVHRLISDLAVLIGREKGHRIIASGDLNILYGYGENGNAYWADRYASIFARMSALGVPFVGPQVPNGRCADPWPAELPQDSKNVPTYHTNRAEPASAARQLDFVFASKDIAPRVRTRALNSIEQWGPSDHCRVEIEIE